MIEEITRRASGKSDYLITCDRKGCKSSLDAIGCAFMDAVDLLKKHGWRLDFVYGTWVHTCPKHDARTQATRQSG